MVSKPIKKVNRSPLKPLQAKSQKSNLNVNKGDVGGFDNDEITEMVFSVIDSMPETHGLSPAAVAKLKTYINGIAPQLSAIIASVLKDALEDGGEGGFSENDRKKMMKSLMDIMMPTMEAMLRDETLISGGQA